MYSMKYYCWPGNFGLRTVKIIIFDGELRHIKYMIKLLEAIIIASKSLTPHKK